jgi:hypothetical protein
MMNPLMSAPIIEQIRVLQQKGEDFWLELSNGRIVQLYTKFSLASTSAMVAVLYDNGFELIVAEQIVAVGPGVHAEIQKQLDERFAKARKYIGEEKA